MSFSAWTTAPFAPAREHSLPMGQLALMIALLENSGVLRPRPIAWSSKANFIPAWSFVLLWTHSPTSLARLPQSRPGGPITAPIMTIVKSTPFSGPVSNLRSATPSLGEVRQGSPLLGSASSSTECNAGPAQPLLKCGMCTDVDL